VIGKIALVAGTGFYSASIFGRLNENVVSTSYGDVLVYEGRIKQTEFVFLSRHGTEHSVPPHKINYRANISALKALNVEAVIALNAVGGIGDGTGPGSLIVPDQIIDYTWGREHTFFDTFSDEMKHIDFSYPYNSEWRSMLVEALRDIEEPFIADGCYGCTQGPRLETVAEIQRLKKDGCTVVGMTGMPEAALAREVELAYASLCFSVNWAAGLAGEITIEEMRRHIDTVVLKVQRLVEVLLD
jgi:5'-methylthioadenosine phosphorylase/5'-methylthioinosine phosphorylase